MKRVSLILLMIFSSCVPEEYDYSAFDMQVGKGSAGGAYLAVEDGLAAVRSFEQGVIDLWLQSPAVNLTLDLADSVREDWRISMDNCIAGMRLLNPEPLNSASESQSGKVYTIDMNIPAGNAYSFRFSTVDNAVNDGFSFAVLSDIQDAVDRAGDFFSRMNNDGSLRFAVSTGDLTSQGTKSEIDDFHDRLASLNVPFFTTAGNHDIFDDNQKYWRYVFGRTSFKFNYKDIIFIFADSSLGTIEARVYGWLNSWLLNDREKLQFFVTHYPAIDPSGVRSGSLNSRNESYKLLAMLLEGGVDVILNGHIHSYYHFDSAGIDTYISGGGGAYPELYDNSGRHYLKITVNGNTSTYSVEKIEID